jgi:uncharacterized membrane protein
MSMTFKLAGAGIGIFLLGILGILLFSALWFRIGFGIAVVVLVGALLYMAWRQDRKDREERAGLEQI